MLADSRLTGIAYATLTAYRSPSRVVGATASQRASLKAQRAGSLLGRGRDLLCGCIWQQACTRQGHLAGLAREELLPHFTSSGASTVECNTPLRVHSTVHGALPAWAQ